MGEVDRWIAAQKSGDPEAIERAKKEIEEVGNARAGSFSAASPVPPVDPRLVSMIEWMRGKREGDIQTGQDWASQFFGANNPQMKEIIDARHAAAFGPDTQTQLAREAGTEGINRSVQSALRQFSGRLPSTGVRGGAAGAMAGLMARDAVSQTRGLERDLAINEMERRRKALGDYESSLTGERAGLLGTTFGYAGLGSQDRYGGMSYLKGLDFFNNALRAATPTIPGVSKEVEETVKGKMSPVKEYLNSIGIDV